MLFPLVVMFKHFIILT